MLALDTQYFWQKLQNEPRYICQVTKKARDKFARQKWRHSIQLANSNQAIEALGGRGKRGCEHGEKRGLATAYRGARSTRGCEQGESEAWCLPLSFRAAIGDPQAVVCEGPRTPLTYNLGQ